MWTQKARKTSLSPSPYNPDKFVSWYHDKYPRWHIDMLSSFTFTELFLWEPRHFLPPVKFSQNFPNFFFPSRCSELEQEKLFRGWPESVQPGPRREWHMCCLYQHNNLCWTCSGFLLSSSSLFYNECKLDLFFILTVKSLSLFKHDNLQFSILQVRAGFDFVSSITNHIYQVSLIYWYSRDNNLVTKQKSGFLSFRVNSPTNGQWNIYERRDVTAVRHYYTPLYYDRKRKRN